MNKNIYFLIIILFLSSCGAQSASNPETDGDVDSLVMDIEKPETSIDTAKITVATEAEILAKRQIPIICYHQIRDWKASDSKSAKDYITPVAVFKDHIKTLADSGYTAILPDQLYDYLLRGKELPEKSVMITFDDNDLTQYENAVPVLKKHGFKGVFFIMTVTIGRPRYMNKTQLKELSDAGNVIGNHTWDHHNVKKYQGEDWVTQIEKPSKILKEITGKEVEHFAYPFGLWNSEAFPELEKRGIKAAYILATKRDENQPLYTIRRMIGSGHWSGKTLHRVMKNTFASTSPN